MSKQTSDTAFPKLWDDLSLRPYLGEIRRRHGIVETLALPSMHDLPPLRIETLFVSPLLAENPVNADSDPNLWPQGKSLLETLQEYPQLVVLGDPGGGKTTLSNWLAWRLSAGLTSPLPPVLEERVPLPCVLREMPSAIFSSEIGLPELAVGIAERLLGDKADSTLKASLSARVEAGSYVLILDGVDEIPVSQREFVADWVQQARQQSACVLATSRIVGYEDRPIDRILSLSRVIADKMRKSVSVPHDPQGVWPTLRNHIPVSTFPIGSLPEDGVFHYDTQGESPSFPFIGSHPPETVLANFDTEALTATYMNRVWSRYQLVEESTTIAQLRYLMPFDQGRIAAFAENWYRQRCGTEQEARQKAGDLLASLAQSDVTRQLARTPNLLSLMAIVHRERAHLPDGKALLYDEIANAYINTIDKQRKIEPGDALAPYGWKERKAWLAYVGFQMQQLRGNQQKDNQEKDVGVLASEKDVLEWLTQAMQASGVEQPNESARTFLSWVARRSGLLLPRGEERYAFVHLSFQEYFCACYLDARIASRAFIHDKLNEDDPVTKLKLAEWSKFSVWRETLVYLFELQSAERDADWVDDLAAILFNPESDNSSLYGAHAALAGRVLVDRHIRLGEKWKDRLADRCSDQANQDWVWAGYQEDVSVLQALLVSGYAAIVSEPLSAPIDIQGLLLPVLELASLEGIKEKLRLRVCIVLNKKISDVAPLSALYNLQTLCLSNTQVEDVRPLAGLNNLQRLDLDNTRVKDITPLSKMSSLQWLNLNETQVADITLLATLGNLRTLCLNKTKVTTLTMSGGFKNLQVLFLTDTKVVNIMPLASCNELQMLYLDRTQVADIAPLAELNNLQTLNLNNTQVEDVKPLAKLKKLQLLELSGSRVVDITPLGNLKNLMILELKDTQVADIAPFAGLDKLIILRLDGTQVVDITPLSELNNLQTLSLANTNVVDVMPLAGHINLRHLDIRNTNVVNTAPLVELKQLDIENTSPSDKNKLHLTRNVTL